MSRRRIPDEALDAFYHEWKRAPHGEKAPVVTAWAARLGVSPATLHRHRQRRFGAEREVTREPEIPQKYIDLVARLKLRVAEAGLEERELSTERCIEVLEQDEVVPAGLLTVSTVNRRLEEAGFRLADPKVRVEADFANQVWQLDFSRSKYLQVVRYDEARADYLLKVSGRHLHYKENGALRNLWLVAAKDMHSRLRLSKGFIETGESALLGLEFLDWCFNREDDGHPMRGVPHVLKLDNGAFAKSRLFKEAAKALGLDVRTSAPYNKDSQGQIENSWRQVWQDFEMVLVAKYDEGWTCYLSDYNALLHEHLELDGERAHPVQPDRSRVLVYRASLRAHPLREVEQSLLRLACHVVERSVDAFLRVRLDNGYYAMPRRIDGRPVKPGDRVRVFRNAEGEVAGRLLDRYSEDFRLEPWEAASWDDFSGRAAPTYRQEQRRLMREERKERRAQARTQAGGLHVLPPRTETIEPSGPFAEPVAPAVPTMSADQARIHIGRQLQELGFSGYADFADLLDHHLHDQMEAPYVDRLIGTLTSALRKAG